MANKKPQIKITVPATAKVGEPVLIDPSGSTDPDGQIVAFDAGVLGAPVDQVAMVFYAPGEYEVYGKITDKKKKTDMATAIVTITEDTPPPVEITITPTALPDLQVGERVSVQLVASGGTAPYTFGLVVGSALPAGLTLNTDGQISGTPTVAGAYSAEVLAIDVHDAHGAHDYTGTVAKPDIIVAPPSDVFSAADVEYLGCLRLPNEVAGAMTWAVNALTGRKVNGETRLLMCISDASSMTSEVFEIADPGTYSTDWQTAPQARFVHWCTDIYQGRRGTYLTTTAARERAGELRVLAEARPERRTELFEYAWRLERWAAMQHGKTGELAYYEFPPHQAPIGGLFWDEASKRIFWGYADGYNVTGRPDWGLAGTPLADDGTAGPAQGPWRFKCTTGDGIDCYGPWRGGYLAIRPDTGELLCGSSIMSGNVGSPFGPDCYGGGRLPAPDHPYDVDLVQPTRYLEYYPMIGKIDQDGRVYPGEPLRSFRRPVDPPVWESAIEGQSVLNVNKAHYGGVDSWRQVDTTGGMVWIHVGEKRGLIHVGCVCGSPIQDPANPGAGHEWYKNPGNVPIPWCCTHGHSSPIQITGPVSLAQFSYLCITNPADCERVARGEIPDYSVDPVAFLNLQTTFGLHASSVDMMGGSAAIGGTYWDQDTHKLYVSACKCDNITAWGAWSSLVHVFRIGGAP